MRYGSVCSGIEAASVAWHDLGWEPQWFSEIEQFPSEVLKHRFPDVPNLGDMTTINQNPIADERPIDLLVGGTPCQSFSVAGLRKGLADPRGNLMLTFLSIADKFRPKWVVWENVPGVLSSNGGRDFATFLTALGNIGYGFAYRVLDAQHFGVAQRRRRVFVVGYLGDWRPPAAVLFERESLQGNPKPSRKKREEVTSDAQGSVRTTGFAGNVESQVAACLQTTCDDYSRADGFNTVIEQVAQPIPILAGEHPQKGVSIDVCPTLPAAMGMGGGHTPLVPHPVAYSFDSLASNSMKSSNPHSGCREVETSKTIDTTTPEPSKNQGGIAIAQPISIAENTIGRQPMNGGNGDGFTEDGPMYTLNATGVHGIAQPIAVDWRTTQVDIEKTGTLKTDLAKMSGPCIANLAQKSVGALCARDYKGVGNQYVDEGKVITLPVTMAIRRLTPKECERLQGFPDDWTKIPYRNKPADQCPDGPRYKACGNSMAVPVMRWIGERINLIESML